MSDESLRELLARTLRALESSRYVFYAYSYIVWLIPAGAAAILGVLLPPSIVGQALIVFWIVSIAGIVYAERSIVKRIEALSLERVGWHIAAWVLAFILGPIIASMLCMAGLASRQSLGAASLLISIGIGLLSIVLISLKHDKKSAIYSGLADAVLWCVLPATLSKTSVTEAWYVALAALMVSYSLAATLYLHEALVTVAAEEAGRDGGHR